MAEDDDVREDAGPRGDFGGPHGAGAHENPSAHDDAGVPPGDSSPGPSGPAPIIDLGAGAVPVRPAKPLGPRRLARLRRELEERSRELAQAGEKAADEELLAKQLRFAELTAQAEAANAGTTGEIQAAAPEPGRPEPWAPRHSASEPAAPEPGAPESSAPEPSAPEPTAAQPPEPAPAHPADEQITVVFPGSGDPDAHDRPDPVHVDPALFSNRLAPEDLAALTHIEIVPAGGSEPPAGQAAGPTGDPAPSAGKGAAPAEGPAPPNEDAAPPGGGSPQVSTAPSEDDVAAAQSVAAPPTTTPSAPGPPATSPSASGDPTAPPPAAPVPAARAEGLELLDPKEYRRRSGPAWAALVLSLVAALVVVVLLFVF